MNCTWNDYFDLKALAMRKEHKHAATGFNGLSKTLLRKDMSLPVEEKKESLITKIRAFIKRNEGSLVWASLVVSSILFWVMLAIVILGFPKKAHAYETIDNNKAIYAVIGEAENQGYKGMLAVACAIRNKGNLKGVYGLNAPRVNKHLYSKTTYLLAQKAWFNSAKSDITNGANHWENINAFGCPYWAKHCVETFRYRDHIFYKEIV